MSDSAQPGLRGPNCGQCRYLAVSWDPRKPYACLRLGFKSQVLPAIEVLRIDGQPCHGFMPRGSSSAAASPASRPAPPPAASLSLHSTRIWQA